MKQSNMDNRWNEKQKLDEEREEGYNERETESSGVLVGEGREFWRAILSSVSPQELLNEHRVCK